MEIMHLREFIEVSELLNFSKAARRLYTTQSALSKHMAKIEAELDATLLERDSHSVQLTEQGKVFLPYARLIVNKYDEGIAQVEECEMFQRQIVSIGYLAGSFGLAMPRLKNNIERAGNYRIRLYSLEIEDLGPALFSGKINVALTHDIKATRNESSESILVAKEHLYLAVPQNNQLASLESISVEELADVALLLPNPTDMPTLSSYYASVIPHYSKLTCSGHYSDVDTLILSLRSNTGCGISCGRHPAFENTVCYIPITGITNDLEMRAIWLTDESDDRLRDFTDLLQAECDAWLSEYVSDFS